MWFYNYIQSSDEIFHHGVDGQKWGVQNGPPYPLDRKSEKKASTATKKALKKQKHKKNNDTNNYPKVSSLSNDELKNVIDRLNLEKQYRDLIDADQRRGYEMVRQRQEKFGRTLGNLKAFLDASKSAYLLGSAIYKDTQPPKDGDRTKKEG